ncbi:RNA polymerase [Western grey kangaroopox virus]|uniref:DNA-directed RNA polymerase 19 kDa subunit n=2 Tax=Macropopoxvirus TaxID=2733295 RepID=A0A2C9DT72_9POXV|nr:RNA polymerase [Western grey kangaroopox virus]YP_010085395.1 RNA polymerase [Eastern grey kangaroopox virus]ATI21041.1 RNA polymerase [Western grey kangaroopox virus]ATI21205.1 RNA polymerase [Eastern grey kangaroopox virus]ATX75112.1 RNA polymerase [Eastern grey kangaroopox virus]
MENSVDINDFLSDHEYSSYDEEMVSEELEPSDECGTKRSDSRVESIKDDSAHSPQPRQFNDRIQEVKRRYTRRVSILEVTGILCESYNLLQRGRIPLLKDLSEETFSRSIIEVMLQEIEEGTCPIVIQKNGELLSISDFDARGVKYHLDYIKAIWRQQKRY